MRQRNAESRPEHHGEPLPGHLQRAVKPAPSPRSRLHEKGRGGRKFAPCRETPQQAPQDDQQRRSKTDARIGGRETDDRDAERHQQNDQFQQRLAATPIGVKAEKDAAERPRHEARAECRQ